MRPCVHCGYRSDPAASPQCPECGEKQLPTTWTVLLREASPWFWRLGHLGSMVYLVLAGVWVVGLMAGKQSSHFASFTYLAILCFPISIAHIRGKRLDDVWIITDTRLEHRSRVGATTFHEASDGWSPSPLRRYKKRSKHLWLIELRKPKGKRPRRVEMIIDDRLDDPAAVEAVVMRRLAPVVATAT